MAALLLCLTSAPALAQSPCEGATRGCPRRMDTESARGMGLGLGLRGTAVSTSAIAYNPAGLAGAPLYHLEGNLDYIGNAKTVALGAAVADSASSSLAGGVAFRGFLSSDHGGYDGIDGRLALAFPFTEAVAIGVAGRYLALGTEVQQADGTYRDVNLIKGFTFDASVQIHAADIVHVAVSAHNLVDHDSPLAPLMTGLSVAISATDTLVVGMDSLLDLTSFDGPRASLGGAIEFLAAQAFPLRAGYVYDGGRKLHQLTAGLGYTDTAVGLDLSLRQDLSGGDDTRVMGAIRFYVN